MSALLFLIFLVVAAGLVFFFGFREGRLSIYRKHIGEALVIQTLERCVPKPYHLLNNVTLRTVNAANPTTQIDHILVTAAGIFVIETKHYSGWIFGDPAKPEWRQVFFQKKISIRNPIFQNHGHVAVVKGLFKLDSSAFHNIVIFSGQAELKSSMGPNVLPLLSVPHYFNADRPTLLDEKAMTYVVGRIEMNRVPRSNEADEYHVQGILQRLRKPAQRWPSFPAA